MKYGIAGLCGFALGVAAMWVAFAAHARSVPPTPVLKPASAIRVTLYPYEGFGFQGGESVDIPNADLERMTTLLTPTLYYGPTVNDFLLPLIAVATVAHPDGTKTEVLIREAGVNPAAVSFDGRNYFYADTPPDMKVGSVAIANLVRQHMKQADGKK